MAFGFSDLAAPAVGVAGALIQGLTDRSAEEEQAALLARQAAQGRGPSVAGELARQQAARMSQDFRALAAQAPGPNPMAAQRQAQQASTRAFQGAANAGALARQQEMLSAQNQLASLGSRETDFQRGLMGGALGGISAALAQTAAASPPNEAVPPALGGPSTARPDFQQNQLGLSTPPSAEDQIFQGGTQPDFQRGTPAAQQGGYWTPAREVLEQGWAPDDRQNLWAQYGTPSGMRGLPSGRSEQIAGDIEALTGTPGSPAAPTPEDQAALHQKLLAAAGRAPSPAAGPAGWDPNAPTMSFSPAEALGSQLSGQMQELLGQSPDVPPRGFAPWTMEGLFGQPFNPWSMQPQPSDQRVKAGVMPAEGQALDQMMQSFNPMSMLGGGGGGGQPRGMQPGQAPNGNVNLGSAPGQPQQTWQIKDQGGGVNTMGSITGMIGQALPLLGFMSDARFKEDIQRLVGSDTDALLRAFGTTSGASPEDLQRARGVRMAVQDAQTRMQASGDRKGLQQLDRFMNGLQGYRFNLQAGPDQGPRTGILAQDLQRSGPIGREMVQPGPDQVLRVDPQRALEASLAGLGRLNDRVEALERGGAAPPAEASESPAHTELRDIAGIPREAMFGQGTARDEAREMTGLPAEAFGRGQAAVAAREGFDLPEGLFPREKESVPPSAAETAAAREAAGPQYRIRMGAPQNVRPLPELEATMGPAQDVRPLIRPSQAVGGQLVHPRPSEPALDIAFQRDEMPGAPAPRPNAVLVSNPEALAVVRGWLNGFRNRPETMTRRQLDEISLHLRGLRGPPDMPLRVYLDELSDEAARIHQTLERQ